MLTRKQQELLVFIHERLQQGGVSPSFDEMKEALGLKSKSGIHRLITGLEERGFIRRLPHRARALDVVRMPDGIVGLTDGTADTPKDPLIPSLRFHPNLIKGGLTGIPSERPPTQADTRIETVALPLYGRIAAGTPIEALRDHSVTTAVPASLLSEGEHYALEVAGDSMVEAGILDGDTVIIRRCESAENGSIIVALIDNIEVTLKRLRQKGQTIALEPANAACETRIFRADRIRIQGRLVGLLRRY